MLITSHEDITVNKRVDTSAFTGMCDDLRIGISMMDSEPYGIKLVSTMLYKSSDSIRLFIRVLKSISSIVRLSAGFMHFNS